jgi:hypothetical protein
MRQRSDVEILTLTMPPEVASPYFEDVDAAIAALASLVSDLADRQRWLAWSDGQYPDESPGDVIAAEPDGTIVLDDGITTWNPRRAAAFFAARAADRQQLRDAYELLHDDACVLMDQTASAEVKKEAALRIIERMPRAASAETEKEPT